MDFIQAFLVTAGRKDLAQDYFEKLAISDDFLSEDEWKQIVELVKKSGGPADYVPTISGTANKNQKFIESYEEAKKLFDKKVLTTVYVKNKFKENFTLNFNNSVLTALKDGYSFTLRKKLIKNPITADIYKTKNYDELISYGLIDISTPRKLNNGSVTLKIGKDNYQLNVSGKLIHNNEDNKGMPPVLKTWTGLKTSEDWDIAWGWLLNYLREVKVKQNKKEEKREFIRKEFISDEDFKKIKDFVSKETELDINFGMLLSYIINSILADSGDYTDFQIDICTEPQNYAIENTRIKNISKYFDIVSKTTDHSDGYGFKHIYLKSTIKFKEIKNPLKGFES